MSSRPRVPAAAQTLAVLGYLGRSAVPVRAGTLARDLGLPRSTVYHLLATMAEAGYVVHLPEDQRFGLGVAAYELGAGYVRQAPLARLSRHPVEALVREVRHTAHLAVLDGRDVVYVIEERAPGRPPLVTDVGVRLPAHLTASGRAILAALPRPAVRALYPVAAAFAGSASAGPSTPAQLRSLLVDVRRDGYAHENGEISAGYASVSIAVRDHTEHPVAAVAVTFPSAEVDSHSVRQIVAALVHTTEVIRQRVAGR